MIGAEVEPFGQLDADKVFVELDLLQVGAKWGQLELKVGHSVRELGVFDH